MMKNILLTAVFLGGALTSWTAESVCTSWAASVGAWQACFKAYNSAIYQNMADLPDCGCLSTADAQKPDAQKLKLQVQTWLRDHGHPNVSVADNLGLMHYDIPFDHSSHHAPIVAAPESGYKPYHPQGRGSPALGSPASTRSGSSGGSDLYVQPFSPACAAWEKCVKSNPMAELAQAQGGIHSACGTYLNSDQQKACEPYQTLLRQLREQFPNAKIDDSFQPHGQGKDAFNLYDFTDSAGSPSPTLTKRSVSSASSQASNIYNVMQNPYQATTPPSPHPPVAQVALSIDKPLPEKPCRTKDAKRAAWAQCAKPKFKDFHESLTEFQVRRLLNDIRANCGCVSSDKVTKCKEKEKDFPQCKAFNDIYTPLQTWVNKNMPTYTLDNTLALVKDPHLIVNPIYAGDETTYNTRTGAGAPAGASTDYSALTPGHKPGAHYDTRAGAVPSAVSRTPYDTLTPLNPAYDMTHHPASSLYGVASIVPVKK